MNPRSIQSRSLGRCRCVKSCCALCCISLGCAPAAESTTRGSQPHAGGRASTEVGGKSAVAGAGASNLGSGGGSGNRQPPPIAIGDGSPANSGGSAGAPASCGSVDVQAEPRTIETKVEVPGNVLFVFDQSASMNDPWNGTPKWRVANDALVAAFEPLQNKVSAGAVLYPTPDGSAAPVCDWAKDWLTCLTTLGGGTNACPDVAPISSPPQISIRDGASFLTAWKGFWSTMTAATGVGTPTEKGLLQGEASLANPPPGNSALVLLTDGQPTCGGNESAIAARLLKRNIKTYVVGLPGARGSAILDAVANAGGTAPAGCTSNCYISPEDSASLRQALSNIATQTVSTDTVVSFTQCEFALSPPKGADPADVHLIVTDAASGQRFEVLRASPDGWILSNDQKTATIIGSVCELAKAGAFTGFSFQYGCVSSPPLPPR